MPRNRAFPAARYRRYNRRLGSPLMPNPLVKVSLVLAFAAAAALAQSTTTAGRQQDLNYIANTLPSLAPNFFFQLDRTIYQNAVAALQARISSATDAEFYVGIEQLVAL